MSYGDKIQALLRWCQIQTDGYPSVRVANFTGSWKDGLAFCAILHRFQPDLLDFHSLRPADWLENNRLAFQTAESIGIPALLDAEDMEMPEKLSIITYVTYYNLHFKGKDKAGGPDVNMFSNARSAGDAGRSATRGKSPTGRPLVGSSRTKSPASRSAASDARKKSPAASPIVTRKRPSPASSTTAINTASNRPSARPDRNTGASPPPSKVSASPRRAPAVCVQCGDPVFFLERHVEEGRLYHRQCHLEGRRANLHRASVAYRRRRMSSARGSPAPASPPLQEPTLLTLPSPGPRPPSPSTLPDFPEPPQPSQPNKQPYIYTNVVKPEAKRAQPERESASQPSSQPSWLKSGNLETRPSLTSQVTERHSSSRPSWLKPGHPAVQPTPKNQQPALQPSSGPSWLKTDKPESQSRLNSQPASQASSRPSWMKTDKQESQPSRPNLEPASQASSRPSWMKKDKQESQPSRPNLEPASQSSSRPSWMKTDKQESQASRLSPEPASQASSRPSWMKTDKQESQTSRPNPEPASQPSSRPSWLKTEKPESQPSQPNPGVTSRPSWQKPENSALQPSPPTLWSIKSGQNDAKSSQLKPATTLQPPQRSFGSQQKSDQKPSLISNRLGNKSLRLSPSQPPNSISDSKTPSQPAKKETPTAHSSGLKLRNSDEKQDTKPYSSSGQSSWLSIRLGEKSSANSSTESLSLSQAIQPSVQPPGLGSEPEPDRVSSAPSAGRRLGVPVDETEKQVRPGTQQGSAWQKIPERIQQQAPQPSGLDHVESPEAPDLSTTASLGPRHPEETAAAAAAAAAAAPSLRIRIRKPSSPPRSPSPPSSLPGADDEAIEGGRRVIRTEGPDEFEASEVIELQLADINRLQVEVEHRGKELYDRLKIAEAQGQQAEERQLLAEWIGLVNERNQLCRREMYLLRRSEERELELTHSNIEHDLRLAMAKPDCQKIETDRLEEKRLLQELRSVVDRRAQITELIHESAQEEAEAEAELADALAAKLQRLQAGQASPTPPASSSKKSRAVGKHHQAKKDKEKDKKKKQEKAAEKEGKKKGRFKKHSN